MKIVDVRQHRMRVAEEIGELELAWSPGTRFMFQRGGNVFVEIYTDEGLTGIGPKIDERFLPMVRDHLVGESAFDIERLGSVMRYYLPYGLQYEHVGGIDIALWDLLGKASGQPLFRLFGSARSKVRPYAAMVQLSEPEERADLASSLRAEGWSAIKLRLHHEKMEQDIRTVELVRAAVGDEMEIMCDANQAQTAEGWQPGVRWDFARAHDTARALRELGCYWLEEPRPRGAFAELRRLRELTDLPIAAGENGGFIRDFVQLCTEDAADILQPECLVLPGIGALRKVGVIAEAFGKRIVPHNGYGQIGLIAHMHLVASWPHAPFVEVIHDPPIGHFHHHLAMFENPPHFDDGEIVLSDRPGLGVDVRRDWIVESV